MGHSLREPDICLAAVALVGGAVDAASFLFLLLHMSLDTVLEPEAAGIVVIIAALLGLLCVFLQFPSAADSGGLFFRCTVSVRAGVAGCVLLDVVGLVRVASTRGVRSDLRLGPLRRQCVAADAGCA
jgi:hypothetical protein